MLYDCHAHLDDARCEEFLGSLASMEGNHAGRLIIFSNSVDAESSRRNQALADRFPSIRPFAGIHPEIFAREAINESDLDAEVEKIKILAPSSSGIGEIGLDPVYGNEELQESAFKRQLEIAESRRVPVTIHSRNSFSKILSLLPSYELPKVLFHWFSGTQEDLKKSNDRGFFVSFGLSILSSKRLAGLVRMCDPRMILAETDSPLIMRSTLSDSPASPFLVASVIFAIASIRGISFEDALRINESNGEEYISAQS